MQADCKRKLLYIMCLMGQVEQSVILIVFPDLHSEWHIWTTHC